MPVGVHTDQKIKDEILTKIRDEAMRVVDAAAHYNVHNRTIYAWLSGSISAF